MLRGRLTSSPPHRHCDVGEDELQSIGLKQEVPHPLLGEVLGSLHFLPREETFISPAPSLSSLSTRSHAVPTVMTGSQPFEASAPITRPPESLHRPNLRCDAFPEVAHYVGELLQQFRGGEAPFVPPMALRAGSSVRLAARVVPIQRKPNRTTTMGVQDTTEPKCVFQIFLARSLTASFPRVRWLQSTAGHAASTLRPKLDGLTNFPMASFAGSAYGPSTSSFCVSNHERKKKLNDLHTACPLCFPPVSVTSSSTSSCSCLPLMPRIWGNIVSQLMMRFFYNDIQ